RIMKTGKKAMVAAAVAGISLSLSQAKASVAPKGFMDRVGGVAVSLGGVSEKQVGDLRAENARALLVADSADAKNGNNVNNGQDNSGNQTVFSSGPNGTTGVTNGNTTTYSNGVTEFHNGNTSTRSDGVTGFTNGNTTTYSDGHVCFRNGNTETCN